MSPRKAKSTLFDPTNPDHLAYYAVSFEGFTLSLEYCDSIDALRIVLTTPEGEELTRATFWNKWAPSQAIDQTFQHELLPMIEYRRVHPERFDPVTLKQAA